MAVLANKAATCGEKKDMDVTIRFVSLRVIQGFFFPGGGFHVLLWVSGDWQETDWSENVVYI